MQGHVLYETEVDSKLIVMKIMNEENDRDQERGVQQMISMWTEEALKGTQGT